MLCMMPWEEEKQRAGTATNGHGTAQRVPTPYRCGGIGSVCLRAGKRNSRTLPLQLLIVGDAPRTLSGTNGNQKGSLSYFLGGKAPSDPRSWAPNMEAVRTAIKYTIATGRLDREVEQTTN
jgi:hypothetical protein